MEELADLIGADALDRLAYASDSSILIDAAESVIGQRDLWTNYVKALCVECGVGWWDAGRNFVCEAVEIDDVSDLLRATPEQKQRALIAVLRSSR